MGFAASQEAFARALIDPDKPVPPGITCARGAADATRFAVYRNNVFVGLTRALATRFPVTRRLVGDDFFAGMARAYAQRHKPATPVILDYGDDFPDFVESFEPARGVPYLADVARIEAAWTRAFHAADAAPLEALALATIALDALTQTTLARHPAASLIVSNHPAGSIWEANQHEAVRPVANWRPETVLVARPALDVAVHVLPARDAGFAAALLSGATLGAAAEAALAADTLSDFGAAAIGLVSLGAFSAAITTETATP